jgi:2-oxoglutarate dehydrogenase E2 component (dihydrolipoamide succinyltransferase)
MPIEIKSPTFPESVADGTIANWVKKEGEPVKQDEVIAEIETDKVVLEVVAPFDGVLSKVIKPAGEIVLSAELIAEFQKDGETDSKISLQADSLPEPNNKIETDGVKPIENQSLSNGPAVKKLLKEHDLDESSIDGSGKDGRITKADIVNHLDESSENTKNEQKIHSPVI